MPENQPRKARRYTVLPDGSVHWLDCPDDYREAHQAERDELGSIERIRLDDFDD